MTDHATMKMRAARLRCGQTPAERALWRWLRLRQVRGVRFLRQYVVGKFILDFYAPSIRLAIELDGGQHYEPGALAYDSQRSRLLAARGIVVLRYTNLDIAQRMDDVVGDIVRHVSGLLDGHPRACGAHPPSALR